jgi:hypothetical protein
MLCVEVCEDFEVYTFSDKLVRVAPLKGFALVDLLKSSQQIAGTRLGRAIKSLQANSKYDRLIVITDEESEDLVGSPKTNKGYILNVASYENGINRNDWTTITGFSESVIDYIREVEKE